MLTETKRMGKIAEFFVYFRAKKKLSQRDIAALLSVDQNHIAKIELGKNKMPSTLLKKLYKNLDNDEKLRLQKAIKEDAAADYFERLNNLLNELNRDE